MIRDVAASDCCDIAEIYNEYILNSIATFETEPITEKEMNNRISSISKTCPYFVYENNGKVLGYCYAHPWKERKAYQNTYETTIYVRNGHQRKGIGKILLNKLIDECKKRNVHALIACISVPNDGSIALHESMGFQKVSHFKEVGLKFGNWIDVVDYQLLL